MLDWKILSLNIIFYMTNNKALGKQKQTSSLALMEFVDELTSAIENKQCIIGIILD